MKWKEGGNLCVIGNSHTLLLAFFASLPQIHWKPNDGFNPTVLYIIIIFTILINIINIYIYIKTKSEVEDEHQEMV